jgi:hypothetical protein
MVGQIQNLLKTQSLEAVAPSAFKQVGGVMFPDATANIDMARLVSIVSAFQSVTSPNYGQPIPQTSKVVSCTGSETLLSNTGNTTSLIQAISCDNGGGVPITCDIKVNAVIIHQLVVNPTASAFATPLTPFYIDSNSPLTVAVTSGTASDLTTNALVIGVCQ